MFLQLEILAVDCDLEYLEDCAVQENVLFLFEVELNENFSQIILFVEYQPNIIADHSFYEFLSLDTPN